MVPQYSTKLDLRRYFRGDAAFAIPEIYEYLEEHGFLYAIRLPSNDVLASHVHRCASGLPLPLP